MKYVLIVIFMHSGFSAEFDSNGACIAAKQAIVAEADQSALVHVSCMSK